MPPDSGSAPIDEARRGPECTLLAQHDGVISAANSAACRLLGRSEQEIIAAGCRGISGASNAGLLDAVRECIRTGAFRTEGVVRRKDGIEIPVDISCVVPGGTTTAPHASIVLRELDDPRGTLAALQKSEATLARAQQLANLGSWEWEIATGRLFWSDQQYHMFGVRPGEFEPTYEHFLALLHPEDRPRLEAAVARALAGEPYQIEFRVVLPDSSIRYIFTQSGIDYDAAGKPVRMVGAALDITDRKLAEASRRQSEGLLESFFSASPAILNILDDDLRYIKTDISTAAWLGVDRDAIVGQSAAELAPDFLREFGPMMRRVIETGRPETNREISIALPTGETVDERTSFFPVALPHDKRGLGIVGVDITVQKRAERALHESEEKVRRSEEQYRLLFETMHQGAIYEDADGLVRSINPAAERILGLTARDLLGRTPHDAGLRAIRPDGSPFPESERPFEIVLATGRELRDVVMGVYNASRQEYRWIEVSAVPLFRTGESKPYTVYTIFDDITDRKRAEDALRDSETRLRVAMDATGLGTFDFYPQTGKLVWSDITKSNFGIAPETEIDHDMFLSAVHPEDRERIRRTGLALTIPGSDGRLATEYRTIGVRDGKLRWLAVHGRMHYDRDGRATRLIGTTLDISERKRLEEKLRQGAEELQTLMDLAPVALHVAHDPECREITGNRTASTLFETVEGANVSATRPGRHLDNRVRFFRDGLEVPPNQLPLQLAAARGIEVRDWELEAYLPSGARKALWGHASPLRDAAGQVRGAIAAFQDITATKQRTDDTLRESEGRFRDTADAAPVIMWYGDAQTRVTFFNRQVSLFTGLPAEELIGHGWAKVIHPDDLEFVSAAYFQSVQNRAGYQIEYRARRADGEYRNMLSTARSRYIGDVYAGQVGIVLDITELKRRQEEHLARQKLESLGTLAGGIAHDFNNLLGGILSQTELAFAELAEGASAQTEIENIRTVAIRGAEIVRQLMVYAGQETEVFELVDVSRLVEQTVDLLKVVISGQAVLRTSLAADVPAVRADPATLRQILINLVTNASEAIGEHDGVIQVTTSRVTPESDSLAKGEYLQLEVSDTGCGMTPATQAQVFDPFFTTKSQGRGLGLPVVQGIVRRLGGEITMRSRIHRGTTFRVLLPGAGKPAAEPRKTDAPAAETQRPRYGTVLIVEDEDSLRLAVSKILRKHGVTVLEAAAGSDALDLLRTHKEHVTAMLLDVTLPGIGSPEVLREARRIRPDLRVILTSAYAQEKIAVMFAGAGLHPFIRKPYRTADILRLLADPAP